MELNLLKSFLETTIERDKKRLKTIPKDKDYDYIKGLIDGNIIADTFTLSIIQQMQNNRE